VRVIHVVRKPLSESSVAANVLKHGTGAINIDAARVAAPGEAVETHSRSPEASAKRNRNVYGEYGPLKTHQTDGQKLGRWPANLILEHKPGCRRIGNRDVKTNVSHHSYTRSGEGFIGSIPDQPEKRTWTARETVEAWDCEPDCPVAGLDRDSIEGGMHGAGHSRGGGLATDAADSLFFGTKQDDANGTRFGDAGGASRFFKQVGGSDAKEPNS